MICHLAMWWGQTVVNCIQVIGNTDIYFICVYDCEFVMQTNVW